MPMNWWTALSASSFSLEFADLLRAAVSSAIVNTTLKPHLLWDGDAEHPFVAELRQIGVTVVPRRVSFHDYLVHQAAGRQPGWLGAAEGAFLRVELCQMEQSPFCLYTDCDVVFLRDPPVDSIRPRFFAASVQMERDDPDDLNSGVMIINTEGMRATNHKLVEHIVTHPVDFAFDQTPLGEVYTGQWDLLANVWNWKPYWGLNRKAYVLHWHGPKPQALMRGVDQMHPTHAELFRRNPGAYTAWDAVWRASLDRYFDIFRNGRAAPG